MVGVDVTEFDFDDVLDHVFGLFERFCQEFLHDFEDPSV